MGEGRSKRDRRADEAGWLAIEGSAATSDEIMAATMDFARELGQLGP